MPQKGERSRIDLQVVKSTAITIEAATLDLYMPDHTTVTVDPSLITITSSAGNDDNEAPLPSTTWTVSALIEWSQAGGYTLKWTLYEIDPDTDEEGVDPDTGSIWKYSQRRFCSFIDGITLVRRWLRQDQTALPDEIIEYEFDCVQSSLYDDFDLGNTYNDLVDIDDQTNMEYGLSYLAAIGCRLYTPIVTPVGDIVSWRIEQTQFTFGATKGNGSVMDPQPGTFNGQLIDEAWHSLILVSVIKDVMRGRWEDLHLFDVSGPSRNWKSKYNESLLRIVQRAMLPNRDYPLDTFPIVVASIPAPV